MHRLGLFLLLFAIFSGHVSAQADITCSGIVAPVVNPNICIQTFSATEAVTVEYTNVGTTTLNAGDVVLILVILDGTTILTEADTLTAAMPNGQTNSYTTIATVDLSASGAHVLELNCSFGPDINLANNSQSLSYTDVPRTFGYTENFDSLNSNASSFTMIVFDVPVGWENAANDLASMMGNTEPDWGPNNGPTASVGGGPPSDNTTGSGNYMYIEDSPSEAGSIELRTPCFATAGATGAPVISFANFSDQSSGSGSDNVLRVDIINVTSGGLTTLNVGTYPGTGVAAWRNIQLDLSAFVPDVVQVQFRTNNNNANFIDDEAIDDFAFFDEIVPLGQAPQPGAAVFDINGASNINVADVSSGKNGPYFATATVGGNVTFTMNGQANQPIIMFTGPLNPRAATFGSIGQFDIGGMPGPNGIPTGLSIVVNGTGSGFFESLFVLNASGQADVGFTIPLLPVGVLGTFQCVMLNSTSGLAFSNAVELTIF